VTGASTFRRAFLANFVLCSFFGMVCLSLIVPSESRADQAAIYAALSGLVVAGLVWGLRLAFGRKPLRPAVLAAFVGGLSSGLAFWAWGVLGLTLVVLVLVVLHIRSFLRRAVHLLEPDRYPAWPDVGALIHVFATMLAAFTLINASLGILHEYDSARAAAFTTGSLGLVDSLYFSIVVMTTLGFGDISPATPAAKLIVALQCLTSYVMFALMIGIITRGILPRRPPEEES
jgi:voltage-gated potassium channel